MTKQCAAPAPWNGRCIVSGSKTNSMSLEEVRDAVRTLTVDGDHVWDGQDEDDRPATEEEMRAALEADMARREVLVHPGRTPVVLGVDTDVVEAFRAGGPDWRARMTAALRAWVDAHPAE